MSVADQSKTAAAGAVETQEVNLLDQILDRTRPMDQRERERNKDFIGQFLKQVVSPGKVVSKDLERAVEFDQSALFKKVYEEEYGQLGGEPYGMLVGDYEFTRHPEDISLLKMLSNVAAASHAPFVTAADPKLFGMEKFTELSAP